MGLDATAYEVAALLDGHKCDEACWEEREHTEAYIIDPSFHRSLRGLIEGACYNLTGKTAHVGNSYSGHGAFREQLAKVFLGRRPQSIWTAPAAATALPFFELIHFADNEGTIGPEAAADLLADFEAGREQWMAVIDDVWLRRKYDEWAEVFRVAAGSGLVVFA